MTLLFVVGGGALIGYTDKITKRAVRNQKYVDLIMNQGETDLNKIANICNIQVSIRKGTTVTCEYCDAPITS